MSGGNRTSGVCVVVEFILLLGLGLAQLGFAH